MALIRERLVLWTVYALVRWSRPAGWLLIVCSFALTLSHLNGFGTRLLALVGVMLVAFHAGVRVGRTGEVERP